MNDLLAQFEACNLNGRASLTWDHGEFITSRDYYNRKVALYAMPGFYSEVWYHPDANQVERIEVLTTGKHLEKYLFQINLDL